MKIQVPRFPQKTRRLCTFRVLYSDAVTLGFISDLLQLNSAGRVFVACSVRVATSLSETGVTSVPGGGGSAIAGWMLGEEGCSVTCALHRGH